MKNIENYKKNTITLDEIQNLYKINDYNMLYKTVNDLINNEKLSPIKAGGGNGRNPGMYKKYRIIRKEEDLSSYLDEINFKLCAEFDVSYYKKHLNKYKEHRKYILMLNDFFLNKRNKLKDYISMNERSFQIWNREKFLQKEEGKTILKNLNIDLKTLNYYDTSEPLAYYSSSKKVPQNVLIIENKDTYYTFRKHLIKKQRSIFNKEINTVIYGAGKNIIKTINDFDISVEEHVSDKRNTIYYFGDLDYEGILIYEKFHEKMSKSYKVKPFIEAYDMMIEKYISNHVLLPETKEGQNKNINDYFLSCFDEKNKEKITTILESGRYIPQEIINIEDL